MSQTITETLKLIERQKHGKTIVESSKSMLRQTADILGENETTMIVRFRDYLVEVFFSEMHPLIVIKLVKIIDFQTDIDDYLIINKLNNESIYGMHSFDIEKKRYCFKATQWLENTLSSKMFYEMLNQYDGEVQKFMSAIVKC